MSISNVRVEMDYSGVGDLLRSSGVQEDLARRGEAVAAAAVARGIMVEDGDLPLPIAVESATGKRARTIVKIDHPSGAAVEAKYRVLVGSLDAARSA